MDSKGFVDVLDVFAYWLALVAGLLIKTLTLPFDMVTALFE